MKFIETSFLYIDSWGGNMNHECFYWKLRCQLVKLQDFFVQLIEILEKINNKLHRTSCGNSTSYF